jgi:hypothetical protein
MWLGFVGLGFVGLGRADGYGFGGAGGWFGGWFGGLTGQGLVGVVEVFGIFDGLALGDRGVAVAGGDGFHLGDRQFPGLNDLLPVASGFGGLAELGRMHGGVDGGPKGGGGCCVGSGGLRRGGRRTGHGRGDVALKRGETCGD